MFKKVSLSVASLAVLTACASCKTLPEDNVNLAELSLKSVNVDNATDVTVPHRVVDIKMADGTVVDVETLKYVKFGFDSSALSSDYQQNLRLLADVIRIEKPNRIIVEGHCDERGTREYNLALGDRRAVAVKKYLVGLGVEADKISTVSFGKERPRNLEHSPAAWDENRRAQVLFK